MQKKFKLAKIFLSYFNEFGGLKTLKYAKHVESEVKYVKICWNYGSGTGVCFDFNDFNDFNAISTQFQHFSNGFSTYFNVFQRKIYKQRPKKYGIWGGIKLVEICWNMFEKKLIMSTSSNLPLVRLPRSPINRLNRNGDTRSALRSASPLERSPGGASGRAAGVSLLAVENGENVECRGQQDQEQGPGQ